MSDEINLPELEGYLTIKDVAKMMGLAYKTVYEYVIEERMKAKRAGDTILIPIEEVRNFKPNLAGRPRTRIPIWRISPEDNLLQQTTIFVSMRQGKEAAFKERLNEIRQKKEHTFPGTVTRYVASSKSQPELVQITLIWRSSVMPDEEARRQALEEFQQSLADVLDWATARYEEYDVVMHA